jgi:hypothetical protein
MTMKNNSLLVLSLLLAASLSALGCEKSTSTSQDIQPTKIVSELEDSINSCTDLAQTCMGTAPSLATIKACRAEFQGCVDQAQSIITSTISSVVTCQKQAITCAKAAKKGSQILACRETLRECVANEVVKDLANIIPQIVGSIPGIECVATLNNCVVEGVDPLTCAADVRECVRNIPPIKAVRDAVTEVVTDVVDAIPGSGCVLGIRQCIKDGKTPAACAKLARTCLKDTLPTPKEVVQAVVDAIPGAECVQDLRACVRAEKSPATCSKEARACLRAELP